MGNVDVTCIRFISYRGRWTMAGLQGQWYIGTDGHIKVQYSGPILPSHIIQLIQENIQETIEIHGTRMDRLINERLAKLDTDVYFESGGKVTHCKPSGFPKESKGNKPKPSGATVLERLKAQMATLSEADQKELRRKLGL